MCVDLPYVGGMREEPSMFEVLQCETTISPGKKRLIHRVVTMRREQEEKRRIAKEQQEKDRAERERAKEVLQLSKRRRAELASLPNLDLIESYESGSQQLFPKLSMNFK